MVARDDAENDREQRDPFELLAPIARRAPRERERATVKADEDAERISTTKTNARRAETTTEGVKTRADEEIEDVTARVRALEAIAREGFAEMSAALKTLTGQVAALSERVETLSTTSERFEATEEDDGSGSYDDDYEEYYEECPPPPPPRRGDRGPTPRRHGPPPRGGHGPPPHERGPPPHARGRVGLRRTSVGLRRTSVDLRRTSVDLRRIVTRHHTSADHRIAVLRHRTVLLTDTARRHRTVLPTGTVRRRRHSSSRDRNLQPIRRRTPRTLRSSLRRRRRRLRARCKHPERCRSST